jgi:transcription elongation factor GreA-like protein
MNVQLQSAAEHMWEILGMSEEEFKSTITIAEAISADIVEEAFSGESNEFRVSVVDILQKVQTQLPDAFILLMAANEVRNHIEQRVKVKQLENVMGSLKSAMRDAGMEIPDMELPGQLSLDPIPDASQPHPVDDEQPENKA